jgi:short-subunit dehydrogenase
VLPHFLARGQGLLVFFGSVAAERGRSSNVIYAATKRGLQSFYESIRHRCSATKIRVQYYQLGYIDTAQTFGKRLPMRPVAPHTVARAIVANLNNDFGAAYYPGYWRLIAVALRNTPWFIFRKLRF